MRSLVHVFSCILLILFLQPVESGIYKNRHRYGDPDRSSVSLGSSSAANFSFVDHCFRGVVTEDGVGYRFVSEGDVGFRLEYACSIRSCVNLCTFSNGQGTGCIAVNFRVDNTDSSEAPLGCEMDPNCELIMVSGLVTDDSDPRLVTNDSTSTWIHLQNRCYKGCNEGCASHCSQVSRTSSQYACTSTSDACPACFTGVNCDQAIDSCECNDPCQIGICVDGSDGVSCDCACGWTGDICDEQVVACCTSIPDVCSFQGTCVDTNSGVRCECDTCFTGASCDSIKDSCACRPDRCMNGGTCVDDSTTSCICPCGWTGDACSQATGEVCDGSCSSVTPCENGGTCTDGECQCPCDFVGDRCETPVPPCCAAIECLNGGTCAVDSTPGVCDCSCQCDSCHNGDGCETVTDSCACRPDRCTNGGTCVDDSTTSCICPCGWTGDACSQATGEVCDGACSSVTPCENGGTCTDGVCQCPCEFTGSRCETPVPPCCAAIECLNGGTCAVDSTPGVCDCSCQCDSCHNGDRCETVVDSCACNDPCGSSGTCVDDAELGAICQCDCGYTGESCDTPIDQCCNNPNLCNGYGDCVDTATGPVCNCYSCWTGYNCNSVTDSCACRPDRCTNGGTCVDNSTTSCICPCGWTGDVCSQATGEGCQPEGCSDVTPCQNGGTCVSGSCDCPCDFIGSRCETARDCCSELNCLNGGICLLNPEDSCSCQCQCDSCHHGDNCEHVLNTCACNDNCGPNGKCFDDPVLGAVCQCDCGFTGVTCEDEITQCCSDSNYCNGYGNCTDTASGAVCQCSQCWTGPRCEAVVDSCACNDPCGSYGTCVDDAELGAICQCDCGYTGESCDTPALQCCSQPNFCSGYGDCLDSAAGPTCSCFTCWTGANCATALDTCECRADVICSDGSSCVDTATGPECREIPSLGSYGTTFTLMFMENTNIDSPSTKDLEVYVASAANEDVEVVVLTPGLSLNDDCYYYNETMIPAHTLNTFDLPICLKQVGTSLQHLGIRVYEKNAKKLVVYGMNRQTYTTEGFLAFADDKAGSSFCTANYFPTEYASQLAVVAIYDNTTITLTYPGYAFMENPVEEYHMNAFDTLQIQSVNDLTGTHIVSSRPVHAYSGNVRTDIPYDAGSRDHLVDELLPTSTWGRYYLIKPIPGRSVGDFVRLVSKPGGVNVRVHNRERSVPYSIPSSSFKQITVLADELYLIEGDVEFQATQFVKSMDRLENEIYHDPAMISVPPMAQYTNNFYISPPPLKSHPPTPFPINVLLIIARLDECQNIKVDGELLTNGTNSFNAMWRLFPTIPGVEQYAATDVSITFGTTHRVWHDDPFEEFMVIAYGAGDRESYGFPAKMKLAVINGE